MQRARQGLIRSGQSLAHINVLDLRQNMNINSDGSLIYPTSHHHSLLVRGLQVEEEAITESQWTS